MGFVRRKMVNLAEYLALGLIILGLFIHLR